MKSIMFFWGFFLFSLCLFAQQDKCTQVLGVLDKVKDACQAYPPQDYCNIFVGQAISDIYNIDDFKSSNSSTGFYSANDIVNMLFTTLSDKWENIGTCNDQNTLNVGQNAANSNRCVIAIWKNPDSNSSGHISLVLPGNLKPGWNGLMVPNAANFAMNAPQLNFVCQRLSGAFGVNKISTVYLFSKKD